MATVKTAYASNAAITCTLNSLASSQTAARASTYVDNSSNLYLDAQVSLILPYGSGTLSGDENVYVYAYGSTDLTNYSGGVTGSDASYSLQTGGVTVLPLIGVCPILAASTTYYAGPYSVAQAFGGMLPERWGIVVVNYTGIALASSGASANFNGLNATVA